MKRVVSAALVLLAAMLFGCGAKGGELTSSDLQKLLSNDYEAAYIFVAAGLPVDGKKPAKDSAGVLYFPTESDKYKTTADLKKLLEETYADEAFISDMLATPDSKGAPLYTDIEGVLHRSAEPAIGATGAAADPKTIAMQPQEGDSVVFTVRATSEDGNGTQAKLTAVRAKNGWRLSYGFAAVLGQSDQGVAQDVFASTAQSFLDALAAGDIPTINELAIPAEGAPDGSTWQGVTYDFLSGAGVSSAQLTETLLEDDLSGVYVATIAAGSGDIFESGSHRYILLVEPSYASDMTISGAIVTGLWREDATPYERLPFEQQENRAINQINRLMQLHGAAQFTTPRELSDDMLTEYLLYELTSQNTENYDADFTLEEVQSMAVKLLGLADFTPAERFYNKETDSYVMLGRGFAYTNVRLEQTSEGNGLVTVEAKHYGDPLRLRCTSRIEYTMKNNWNGTYELVSGILLDE